MEQDLRWAKMLCFFFSSRRRHTRYWRDWSSDVCSSDLFGNKFALVCFSALAKHLQGVRLRNALPHNGFFLGNQLHHFGFNRSEVSLFNHRFARVYIVIEPVLDSRSDAELDSRIQFLQGFRQQVRARMPERMFSFFILPFVKHEIGVFSNGTPQIVRFAIHSTSQNFLRQTRADALRNLQAVYSFIVLPNGAIGKFYLYHNMMMLYFHNSVAKIAKSFELSVYFIK